MKKFWLLTTLLLGSFLLAGCNKTLENPEINIEEPTTQIEEITENEPIINEVEEDILTSNTEETEETKSLILVFSPTGNTKRIATFIAEINNVEMIELIPEVAYTAEDLDYSVRDCRANKEQNDDTARPWLATEINLDWYDRIYLWYPIWWWTNPKLILTLLEKYDFSGKEVVLFCTSGSSGIETSVSALKAKWLNVIWSKRFSASSSKEEVQEWLESL